MRTAHVFESQCLCRYSIPSHITFEDRMEAAAIFKKSVSFECAFAVDTMKDETNLSYGALPERTAIILDGKVQYIGGIGPFNYDLVELEKELIAVLKK